jgi:hypothetical protein
MADTISGTLISRNYNNFKGVDFSNRKDEVSLNRSPDALNMWRNYKSTYGRCVETRPDIELLKSYSDTIFGLFFYAYNGTTHKIVHSGTKLYDEDKVIYSGMAEHKSNFFVYGNKLYIKDGSKYLVYDGTSTSEVVGFIPTTTIGRSPAGSGTVFQDVNMLNGIRKNSFVSDGESVDYILDAETFDSDYSVRVWVNDKEITEGFTAYPTQGKITFNVAPEAPLTTGQDNVIVQFRKTIEGYRDRIDKCTLLEVFDNRIFFSGNPDYPHVLFHSSLDDPTYCSDLDYYEEGTSDAKVNALISGNNALWVLKEPSQANTTIFYHNPTIDTDYGKVYPSTHSSISEGCVSTGINFKDDIVFFSNRGMDAISGDVTTEQVLAHRSTLIDNRLLNETDYKNLTLAEYEGYLLVFIGNKVYLADSNSITSDFREYEWFYWKLSKNISSALVKDGVLYLCSENEIYTLTNNDEERELESYWTTLQDEFKYPQYQKTTNKRGCVADVNGKEVVVYAKTDSNKFEKIDKYKIKKDYVVSRIKKKKWKSIQLKFYSTKVFSLYSCTLESYIGSYVKR